MAIEQSCQGSPTQSENFVPLTFLDSLEYQLGSLYLQGQSMTKGNKVMIQYIFQNILF